jgi:hypothetical protein
MPLGKMPEPDEPDEPCDCLYCRPDLFHWDMNRGCESGNEAITSPDGGNTVWV